VSLPQGGGGRRASLCKIVPLSIGIALADARFSVIAQCSGELEVRLSN
jgi:hypothetical protein